MNILQKLPQKIKSFCSLIFGFIILLHCSNILRYNLTIACWGIGGIMTFYGFLSLGGFSLFTRDKKPSMPTTDHEETSEDS